LTDFTLPVAAVFFTPDGTQLLATEVEWTDNGAFTSLWDIATAERKSRFPGARLLAMSPDGQTALLDQGLWHWSAEAERKAPLSLGPALSVAPYAGVFLPDGTTVATGGFGHPIVVQKMPGREVVTTLYGHTGRVRALAVSPSDTLLASGSDDGVVFLWDTLTWDVQSVFPNAGERVWVVAYSPDGNQLAAGCEDGTIRIWDPTTSRARMRLAGDLPRVTCLGFVSNDQLAIAGVPTASSWGLWDATTGRLVKSYESPGEKVETLAVSPTEPLVALGIAGASVRVVDRMSGETRYTIPQDKVGKWEMRELGFSPDGRFLAGARARGPGAPEEDPRTFVISVWDATNGQEVLVREDPAPRGAAHGEPFAFSPDSQLLAAPCVDQVDFFDLAARTIRTMPGESLGTICSVAYSPDGQWIALGTKDWSLRLIDPHNPTREKKLVGPRGLANNLAFSPDGWILVSGSSAGEVTLWDVQTGEEMCTLTGPTGEILCLAFSPDGTRLVASSELPDYHAAIHIWHAPRPAEATMRTTHQQTYEGP
jgi:WD40 repeat protein